MYIYIIYTYILYVYMQLYMQYYICAIYIQHRQNYRYYWNSFKNVKKNFHRFFSSLYLLICVSSFMSMG